MSPARLAPSTAGKGCSVRCSNVLVSGSDWVAVAGIVTGGVVTISVAGLNYWFQHRSARLVELRDVLDSAAGAVSEAVVAAQRRVVAQGDDVKKTGENYTDKFGSVQLSENRIAIRLGKNHSVAQAYRHVEAELQRISTEFWYVQGALDRDAQKDANELIDVAKDAQLRYLESARAVVNQDL
jgi:hypothetical protein